jgi:ribosomal protein L29
MKWRDTAGLTVAVLALLGIGSQPVARWIATRTVSQFVSADADLLGSTHWDPARHAWTCYDLKIAADGGESIRVARSTIRIDANEFLRRNLVIDSAQADGIVVRVPMGERASSDVSQAASMFPAFSSDAWMDSLLNQHKGDVLSAARGREQRRKELQQDLERLQKRCAGMQTDSSSNPLRGRGEIQEVQREIANLLQALAEERIRVRETDRELEQTVKRLREGWREDVARSIAQSLPERSRLIQQIAEQSIAEYWESRRALLSYAAATAKPLKELKSNNRGTEIPIVGISKNYLRIRTATLSGWMEIGNRTPVRFQASIQGWGDRSGAVNPKSDWRFELASSASSPIIHTHVERADDGEGWIVTWCEDSDAQLACRGHLLTTDQGERLEISIPLDALSSVDPSGAMVFGGATEWQTCWKRVLLGYRERELVASLPLVPADAEGVAGSWHCTAPQVHPDSLAVMADAWDKTLEHYTASVSDRMQSRIGGLCVAMEQFRSQGWIEGVQTHSTNLAEIERKTLDLRASWDMFGTLTERLARMRGAKEGY